MRDGDEKLGVWWPIYEAEWLKEEKKLWQSDHAQIISLGFPESFL